MPPRAPIPAAPGSNGRATGLDIAYHADTDAVIRRQQRQIDKLERDCARLRSERNDLNDLLIKAEINEQGLRQRLGELQAVVMGRQPAPPPDTRFWRRLKWAVNVLFATASPPKPDVW